LAAALGLVLLALAASHLGALHPAGDSLAVVRPVLIALALLLGVGEVLAGWRRAGGLAALLALAFAVPLVAEAFRAAPAPVSPALRVYAKNLWAGNRDTGSLVADILASGADIVLLQEVSDTNRDVLARLAVSHPHQHLCRYSGWSGIALASRWPLEDRRCTPARAAAAARVAAPFGPVWAVSVHLPWPWPYEQAERAEQVSDLVAGLAGEIVIGGDFNMTPWGHAPARIAVAAGARRLGPLIATFRLNGYPLALDHILTTGTGRVEARPRLGSDHLGVLAAVEF
jgi:endonuclease/exonuclease/phosphatase (EEP) superfamily protein YafD